MRHRTPRLATVHSTEPAADTDEAAAQAYARNHADLVRFLARLLGDVAAAEDVAQDAGIRLLTASRTEPDREAPGVSFPARWWNSWVRPESVTSFDQRPMSCVS
jgi:DNA-directed RNA polymerase specialized sigma24 family protein